MWNSHDRFSQPMRKPATIHTTIIYISCGKARGGHENWKPMRGLYHTWCRQGLVSIHWVEVSSSQNKQWSELVLSSKQWLYHTCNRYWSTDITHLVWSTDITHLFWLIYWSTVILTSYYYNTLATNVLKSSSDPALIFNIPHSLVESPVRHRLCH